MRFFRIARILNIPDILQFLHILRSSNSIRLTRMLCLLFTVWLSAAGFVHLVILMLFIGQKKRIFIRIYRSKIRAIFFKIIQIPNQLRIFNVFIFLSSQWGKMIDKWITDSLTCKSMGIYEKKKKLFCFYSLVLSYAWSFILHLISSVNIFKIFHFIEKSDYKSLKKTVTTLLIYSSLKNIFLFFSTVGYGDYHLRTVRSS